MTSSKSAVIDAQFVGKSKSAVARAPRYPIAVERVSQRLQELGLGPVQVAERTGLERTYLTDLLSGKKRSVNGQDRLQRLAKALRCTPGFLTGTKAAARLPASDRHGLVLAGTVAEGVARPVPPAAALPNVPVQPDPRFPGAQAVFAVQGHALASVGAPEGAWLLAVDARAFVGAAGTYRPGQLVICALCGTDNGHEELCVRRVIPFADRVELHPVDGHGPAYVLGRPPRGKRLEVRAVVLRAIQELV